MHKNDEGAQPNKSIVAQISGRSASNVKTTITSKKMCAYFTTRLSAACLVFVRCLCDACAVPVRGLSGACPLSVRCLFGVCSMSVQCLSGACPAPIRCLCGACPVPARCLPGACAVHVRRLSSACPVPVRCLFDACPAPYGPVSGAFLAPVRRAPSTAAEEATRHFVEGALGPRMGTGHFVWEEPTLVDQGNTTFYRGSPRTPNGHRTFCLGVNIGRPMGHYTRDIFLTF